MASGTASNRMTQPQPINSQANGERRLMPLILPRPRAAGYRATNDCPNLGPPVRQTANGFTVREVRTDFLCQIDLGIDAVFWVGKDEPAAEELPLVRRG